MERAGRFLSGALVLLSFVCVALVQTWPLPLHLTTRFTASPAGDTAVYVWNTWVFGYELLERHRSPFTTESILALGGPADLSLHNYTVFADLLAIPLQPLFGIVGAFNVIFLLNFALAGLGMFLLARHVLAATPRAAVIAWLAALLFACSPFIVARGNGHVSLAAAAPIPFFVLYVDRMLTRWRLRDAALAGVAVAWAAYCDPYYAIYCAMLGTALLVARGSDLRLDRRASPHRGAIRTVDALVALLVVVVVLVHVIGGGTLRLGSLSISMQTLYTPMLALTTLVIVRLALVYRPSATWVRVPMRPLVTAIAVMTAVATILLAPQLLAIATRASEGRMVAVPVPWRSSAPGVDLLALALPNPNHPLAPPALVDWVQRQPGESIASLPWVALLIVACAWRRARFRPQRAWLAITLAFAWISLGPFVRVGGFDTAIPTPWTLLRYAPVIDQARMPARFSVVVIMGLSIMFAGALAALVARYPARRRAILCIVGGALAFELLAAPRRLFPADVPAIYKTLAADSRDLRVLGLPFGLRDGLTTYGAFNPAALYYQTRHGKRLVSGYLSRISDARKELYLSHPTLGAFLSLGKGRALTSLEREAATSSAAQLIDETEMGWVVLDDAAAAPALREFAVDVLGLVVVDRQDGYTLYEVSRQAAGR